MVSSPNTKGDKGKARAMHKATSPSEEDGGLVKQGLGLEDHRGHVRRKMARHMNHRKTNRNVKTRTQDTLPEWSKGVDSSSTSESCVGSNPTGVNVMVVGRFWAPGAQDYVRVKH